MAAQTNAQRQAAYRARRFNAGQDQMGDRRVNGWISTGADIALDRLARYNGLTRRAMLERLILAEDELLRQKLDDEDFSKYIQVTP
jgi:hypothetical protein